ncbi:TonB-dependent siderophore receptor [Aliarcobacter butzleri]|uniref:TonB-dependent siderophore receptor n=1 Tax=Aliarcobacter butzleri TaxID=28197 RepID=UPI00125FD8D0|nr:TonB-dependent siderophore receptor [Aliarcobacter butzleri]MCG3697583.1 TonB-dependent siderophore receptor [Aliarcobacter butzleri]MCG3699136.1 TonB-dependent siderophore receptor [Aliarcobacter butzleri]MCG3713409.1 TonB-dependent siderophore receptor [Aliarcobacter butzleri]MCT7619987.1 TonB-dependent siderophore receptor [Aliarcobacter butzleri]MDN5080410.1 TonB-dependent siderophore receptor [Aliarcobacter butzleri]
MKNDFIKKNLSIKLCAILLTSSTLFAQEQQTTTSKTNSVGNTTLLEEISVNENQSSASTSYTVKETTSATKLDLSLKETPQSITVITQKQIEDQNLQDINDVLMQTPGVSITQMGQKTSGFNTYYARGMQITNVQRDGVPTSIKSFGTPESMGLESSALYEKVEITRGSTGLTNGSGNPSASINYVRKKPTKEFEGNAKVSYGSWDNYKGTMDISGGLNEDKSIRGKLVASYGEGDNQQDRYHQDNSLLYSALDFDLSDNTLLTTSLSHQKVNADNVAVHHFNPLDTNGNSQNIFGRHDNPAANWTYTETEKTNLSLGLEHYFNNDWKAVANYSFSKSKTDRLVGLSRTVLNTNTGNIQGMALRAENTPEVHSIDLYTSGNIKALDREHKLSFGVNGYSLKSDDPNFVVKFPSTGNANITVPYKGWNGNVEKPNITENGRNKVDEKEIGAFAALNIELSDPLHLIIGSRITKFERVNNKGKTSQQEQKYDGEVIPYLGLVYDIDENFSTYASYTSIFNPTSTNKDSSGNYLDPEEGSTVEFGLKSEFYDGNLNTSIAYFITKQDNLAVKTNPLELTPDGEDAFTTTGGAKIKGWDLTVGGEILENWNMSGGYTYTDAKDKDGIRLNSGFVPKQTFKLFTSYKYNKFTLGGGVNWQSEINALNRNANKNIQQKGYAVVNAMAKYEVKKDFDVILNVNNLFDEEYRYYPGEGGYGDERNYTLSLNYKF